LKPGSQQVEVSVDQRDIQFDNKNGKWRADFGLIVAQYAPDGRRFAGERSQCVVDRETYAEAQSKELLFRRDIAIQPEADSLRVLARDASNGAVGSPTVPIGHQRKSKGKSE